jgi:hypothetical protein
MKNIEVFNSNESTGFIESLPQTSFKREDFMEINSSKNNRGSNVHEEDEPFRALKSPSSKSKPNNLQNIAPLS